MLFSFSALATCSGTKQQKNSHEKRKKKEFFRHEWKLVNAIELVSDCVLFVNFCKTANSFLSIFFLQKKSAQEREKSGGKALEFYIFSTKSQKKREINEWKAFSVENIKKKKQKMKNLLKSCEIAFFIRI